MHRVSRVALAATISAILTTPALAADPKPPEPIDAQHWIERTDYPRGEMAQGHQGIVRFALSIDAGGKVYRCDVLLSSGVETLDRHACDLMRQRGRFRPALDGAGVAIPAVWTRHVNWSLVPDGPRPHTADFSLDVKSLPDSRPYAELTIAQIIAADGKIERCTLTASSDIPALDAQACAAAAKYLTPAAMVDAAGQPVRGLKISRLLFKAAAGE